MSVTTTDAVWDVLGLSTTRAMSCPDAGDQRMNYGLFLYGLVRARCSKRVLEIGTFHGFGSIALRRGQVDSGLANAELWLIEFSGGNMHSTLEHMRAAGVYDEEDSRIHALVGTGFGRALNVPAGLDLVVEDADHDPRETLAHLNTYLPKLAPGGLLLFHDLCGEHFPATTRAVLSRLKEAYEDHIVFRPGGSYLAVQNPQGWPYLLEPARMERAA